MSRAASVSFDPDLGCIAISSPYDEAFVSALKAMVPGRDRAWVPKDRLWLVYANQLAVLALVERYFPASDLRDAREALRGQRSSPPPPPRMPRGAPGGNPWVAVMEGLPEHLREPLYRAVLRVLHPDVGGDTDAAQQINVAMDLMRRAS